MKWTTTTALILTAGAGALWVNRLLTPAALGPRELLAELEREERAGAGTQHEAMRRLTEAIEREENLRDPAVAAALFEARAAVYRALGAYSSAREDLERVLLTWKRSDPSVELEVTELIALEGQWDAALLRVRRLVAREEAPGRAYALLGRLEAHASDTQLQAALALCDENLDLAGAQRAMALLGEARARGPRDPRTPELWNELRTIFRTHERAPLQDVLELGRRAADSAAAALDAYARAMELEPSPEAVRYLAGLLAQVGLDLEASDLLLASRVVPACERSPELIAAAIPVLEGTGRIDRSLDMVARWDWSAWGGDLEFHRSVAEALYRAGHFGGMTGAAKGLLETGGTLGEYWYRFFGSAQIILQTRFALSRDPEAKVNVESLARRIKDLRQFARENVHQEPFPGARIEAYFLLAEAHRLLGEEADERIALATALPLVDALGPTAPEPLRALASADAWARLAELESHGEGAPWERIERRYTRAIDAEPARTWEFLERWEQAGDRDVASSGLDLAMIFEETKSSPDGRPLRKVGPSVLTRIARFQLERRETYGALKIAQGLLDEYPNLVPALDVFIEAQLGAANPAEVLRSVLRRLELVGADERSDRYLSQLRTSLTPEDVLRAIQAAPKRFARPAAAELALVDGDVQRAAELLEEVEAVEYSADLRLVRARTRLASGQVTGAVADFERLLDDPIRGAEALLGLLDARLRQGDRNGTDALVQRAIDYPLGAETRSGALELVLARGRLDLAGRLIGALDRSVESRTPLFYRQLVRYAMLAGDADQAREAIARAEPYVLDGTPDLAEVLLLVQERAWTRLPDAVARLRGRELPLTPVQDACLALLEERLAQGLRAAERGLAANPRDPEWALVRAAALGLMGDPIDFAPWFGDKAAGEASETLLGSRRGRRDPRETIAILFASELEAWHPWATRQVLALAEQRAGTLWPAWLELRLQLRAGDRSAATAAVDGLTRAFPAFGPAWDLRLDVARAAHPGDPLDRELLQLRLARLRALGERTLEDSVDVALARASEDVLAGADERAVRKLLEPLVRERRLDFEPRFMLGTLLARAGHHALAQLHLFEAERTAPPGAAPYLVDALVSALERGADPSLEQRGTLSAEDQQRLLGELVKRFPGDPLAALALVRNSAGDANVTMQQASAARFELSRLARSTGKRTLEDMRRGSTGPWVEFLLTVSPVLAQEVVEGELHARPGDAELWELAGRVAQQLGQPRLAERRFQTVLEIRPSAVAAFAIAERKLRERSTPQEVERSTSLAAQAVGSRANARIQFIRALIQSRRNFPDYESSVQTLQRLWDARDSGADYLDPLDVGFALVANCLQYVQDLPRLTEVRAKRTDAAALPPLPSADELSTRALQVLDELRPLVGPDEPRAVLLSSYGGLARRIAGSAAATSTAMAH